MSRNSGGAIVGGMGCGMLLFILTIFAVIGAVCWPYTINTWLVFAGKAPVIVWWQGSLLGFCPVLGQISIPAAVVTWILMMFLG